MCGGIGAYFSLIPPPFVLSRKHMRQSADSRLPKTADQKMALAFPLPARPASPTRSPRQAGGTPAIRRAARIALVGAKQVGRAVLVLGIFAVMLAAAMALGLLIWVPRFHINW